MMRQLIVLGGGGFLMEKSRALDNYFLRATGKPNPRICFVGTASGDAESGPEAAVRDLMRAGHRPAL